MDHLIAIDWGTHLLHGALLNAQGRVLERQSHPRGVHMVAAGEFGRLFELHFSDWVAATGAPSLISGMAGSRRGWVETPYCPCPAGLAEIAEKVTAVEAGRIAITPGLMAEHAGVPDLMRGEETKILGAIALTGLHDGLYALPGMHSWWARVENARIASFRSYMGGELYTLLTQHSALAPLLDAQAPLDEAAFLDGVTRADNGAGLLHNALGARALALTERMPRADLASYLSGLLIGEELRIQTLHAGREVVLIGTHALTARYSLALSTRGIQPRVLGEEATWAGLHALGLRFFARE